MDVGYISRSGLLIDYSFYSYVRDELCVGSKVTPSAFWKLLGFLVAEYADRNAALLAERELVQQRIDSWFQSGGAVTVDSQLGFLRDAGYLLPECEDYKVDSSGIDYELGVAGPQLVAPADNARYLLNAVNARWGSLKKALRTGKVASSDERVLMCMWLDSFFPLDRGCWADVTGCRVAGGKLELSLGYSGTTVPGDKLALVAWKGAAASPGSVLLVHNGLHVEVCCHDGSVSDVVLEAAPTVIVDFEDAVASADMEDKIAVYRNWDGLMRRNLCAMVGGNLRTASSDSIYNTEWGKVVMPGRALMLVRNVGMHRYCDGIMKATGEAIPEAFVDLVASVVAAMRDNGHNSKKGSIYIVKPKLHGPEEVAFTVEMFAAVERWLGLAENTLKIGIMDEERRTSLNLRQSLYPARHRLFFVNTGFLDRTGDEIRTSSYAGAMIPKAGMRTAAWFTAYEKGNVAVGLDCEVPQIGKGMWDRPAAMKELLQEKIAHPESGANCAWVPSPVAAVLHSIHYHQVDVAQLRRGMDIAPGDVASALSLPLLEGELTDSERRAELEDSALRILGYVARWVYMGLGCSSVPDRDGTRRMEDLATLRISSQQLANWKLHGLCDDEELLEIFKAVAVTVDEHNAGQENYVPILPDFNNSLAFQAALQLVQQALQSPNGYVERPLQQYRVKFKQKLAQEATQPEAATGLDIGALEGYWFAMRGRSVGVPRSPGARLS